MQKICKSVRGRSVIEQLEPRALFSVMPAGVTRATEFTTYSPALATWSAPAPKDVTTPQTSAPAITTQPPSNVFALAGSSATMTASASGDPAPTVQWEVSLDGVTAFVPITDNASATTDTLILPSVQYGDEFNQYEAVFTNSAGTAVSDLATLYVEQPTTVAPVITTQPASQSVAAGSTATFTASATGTPSPTVQWYVQTTGTSSFVPITGNASATTTTLTISDATAGEDGNQYEAVFTNAALSVTTDPAMLTVTDPAPTATLPEAPLRKAQTFYYFTVNYSASAPIVTSTFDIHNLFVTGPDGYLEPATFISYSASNDGNTVSVTYRLKGPASRWTASDNGKYHVYLRSGQVMDADGDYVPGGILGPFKVLIA
jgi:hypothetical protein